MCLVTPLQTIPSLVVDLRDGAFDDLRQLWLPSTVLAAIVTGGLFAVEVALRRPGVDGRQQDQLWRVQ